MTKQELKEYLAIHLSIRIDESCRSFTASEIVVKLMIDGEVISSDYVTIKKD
jgi:hypothetical protein